MYNVFKEYEYCNFEIPTFRGLLLCSYVVIYLNARQSLSWCCKVMNKVSVLALLICFIALCYIGGYFSVLNYEQFRVESQSLHGGKVLTTTDLRTVTRNAHTDKMSSQASLRTSNIRLANPPEASLRILDVNTTAPTLAPTGSSPPFRKYIESALISSLKPVTSDVRGNLGPAGTITNERMEDWLTDRWQGK